MASSVSKPLTTLGPAGRARSLRVVCLGLRFEALRSSRASEGLAPFLGPPKLGRDFPSDRAAAAPHEREKGNPGVHRTQKPEDRDEDRRIDPTSGKNTTA